MREQVLEQRIKSAASAWNLVKRIPDERLRDEFIDSLRASAWPFAIEHPPIKAIKLIEDSSGNSDEDVDERLLTTPMMKRRPTDHH